MWKPNGQGPLLLTESLKKVFVKANQTQGYKDPAFDRWLVTNIFIN